MNVQGHLIFRFAGVARTLRICEKRSPQRALFPLLNRFRKMIL